MSLVNKIVFSRGVCRKNVDKNDIDTVVHNVRCVCVILSISLIKTVAVVNPR